ncbi:MAG TPA: dephospho-CoA kinase [Gemmatimonadales bacterium]|nr:dephospho-CoA kinase [Gemmatimonadales bacterium]
MLNVALTGNIAAGKSTVLELFRRWGATVVDADALAREAQAPGTEVLTAIAKRFGSDVIGRDGALDRAALRAKVMGDDAALADLNAIVHPAVRRRRDQIVQEARERGDAIVVNDIPLLFEALDPASFDLVILVDAPVAVRRARLRTLRGLAADDADRMIAAQMPAERKRARSHFVIENAGSRDQLEREARRVFDALRRRAAPIEEWASVVLVTSDARDAADLVPALAARCADANIALRRATAKSRGLAKALRADPPSATIATREAQTVARAAWIEAGRPGRFYWLDAAPEENALPLDLRPWGGPRLRLGVNPLA